jgi:hypothetical protein
VSYVLDRYCSYSCRFLFPILLSATVLEALRPYTNVQLLWLGYTATATEEIKEEAVQAALGAEKAAEEAATALQRSNAEWERQKVAQQERVHALTVERGAKRQYQKASDKLHKRLLELDDMDAKLRQRLQDGSLSDEEREVILQRLAQNQQDRAQLQLELYQVEYDELQRVSGSHAIQRKRNSSL